MLTSSAKNKGRTLQKTVRDAILKIFPILEFDDVKSTSMGKSGVDVELSPAAKKILPLAFECKNLAKIAVYKYYEQAQSNAKNNEPVVVIKQNRSKPLVLVDLEYFLRLHEIKETKSICKNNNKDKTKNSISEETKRIREYSS